MKDSVMFLQQLRHQFETIGAVFPTSPAAARAMVAEAKRHVGPRSILEVGAGTGAITAELVKILGPDDRLVLCELNASFVDRLHERFEREPAFADVRHQVEIVCDDVTRLEGENEFDFIISSVPFTSLSPEVMRGIVRRYRALLKPGGVLSYLEYAHMREIRTRVLTSPNEKAEREAANRFLDEMIENYQFRRDSVGANIPPTWVRSLRFDEITHEQLEQLEPLQRNRIKVGPFSMASPGLGWVAGLGATSLLMKKKKWKGWTIPLALAGAAAWFHRDPERRVQTQPELALAPADGKVLKVEKIRHPRLGDQTWVRVNIFLSLADVHINRAPVAGVVVDHWTEPGGYSPAYQDDAENNEASYIVIEGRHGRCAIAQRTGALARTIHTWARQGELLCQGERYGMIRLGSRTDLYLPDGAADILVAEGDRVIAGRTPLAKFRQPEPSADEPS